MRISIMLASVLWATPSSAALKSLEADDPAVHPAGLSVKSRIEYGCDGRTDAGPRLLFMRTDDGRMRLVGVIRIVQPTC